MNNATPALPADVLTLFPELRFAAGRATLLPAEVAGKLGVTSEHVLEFIESGKLERLNMTGAGNLTSRQCWRIPVSAYEAFVRTRLLIGYPPAPAPAPDPLEEYPELQIPDDRALSLPQVADLWSVDAEHVLGLVECGDLAALDMTGAGNRSDRRCLRIPVTAYHACTRRRLDRGWRPKPAADDRQTEFGF